MSARCSMASCGNCGRCTAEYEGDASGHRDCDHPEHWRKPASDRMDSGQCRLCGASESTIRREAALLMQGERINRV